MTKLSDLPAAAAADGTERGIVNQGSGDGTTSLLSAAQTVVNRAATATRATAIGVASSAANNAVALGYDADSDIFGVAIGDAAQATGDGSVAIGWSSISAGVYATATGYQSTASGAYSLALGKSSAATGAYAVAIGATTANAVDNTVSVGLRGFIMAETSGLGNPPANSGMLFVEDTGGGKSRLVIKWPDGTTEVLATQA